VKCSVVADSPRIFHDHNIQSAAASFSSSRHANFSTDVLELCAEVTYVFSRECSSSNSCVDFHIRLEIFVGLIVRPVNTPPGPVLEDVT